MEPQPIPPERVSEVVTQAMAEANLSQRQVADATKIPLTTLNRRLTTDSPFTVIELRAIALLLGLKVSEIFQRAERVAA